MTVVISDDKFITEVEFNCMSCHARRPLRGVQ